MRRRSASSGGVDRNPARCMSFGELARGLVGHVQQLGQALDRGPLGVDRPDRVAEARAQALHPALAFSSASRTVSAR